VARTLWISALALVHSTVHPAGLARAEDRVTVHPADTGVALENPGMGWVFHHFDNSIHGYGEPLGPGYDGREFPGLTVAYLRLGWSYLEPREGRFNWSVVDTPAQRYIAAGKKIALRITSYEGDDTQPYATPKWVRDAGAKGYDLGKCWEPDYDDPVYLAKLDRFLAALGERYDDNPNVAFVDVGTLGIWGEGHPIARNYALETVKRHMDMHRKHLPHTLLAAGDDFANNFTDDDLIPSRRSMAPLAFAVPESAHGKAYSVYAGLWIPGDASRPNARLLPSNGNPDRRVPVGDLSFSNKGEGRFTPRLPGTKPGGDFEIVQVSYEQTGARGILEISWDVRQTIAGNVQPFCHLDRDGTIAIGGGRIRFNPAPIEYARKIGLTLRDDSILVEPAPNAYYSDGMAEPFWPRLPVIIESAHYGYAKQTHSWRDGSGYLRAVEDYHASYVSIHADPREFLLENRELIARMNRRIGYRLELKEVSWPRTASRNEALSISATWSNVGVAPCYPDVYPTWWLMGAGGEILAALVDDGFPMRGLSVAPPDKARPATRARAFPMPSAMAKGLYDLRVSVGDRDGTPRIALPLPGDDGHRRYPLGKMQLE
jgi:Domain of unknown function (DUF4832)